MIKILAVVLFIIQIIMIDYTRRTEDFKFVSFILITPFIILIISILDKQCTKQK